MSTDASLAVLPPPPIPNSYWVEAGRLLAGEYPGSMSRAEAMERMHRLLKAGVTSFIDLTEEGELPAYHGLFPSLTERRIRYQRLPILDHSLPLSPAHMGRVLDSIAAELEAGRCVYVHCHAGIGRTGMAIGCHLIRSGLPNEHALARLQLLWRQCERSRRWPSVPETPEQVDFVLRWCEPVPAVGEHSAGLETRYEGALVGLAIGDALGSASAAGAYETAAPGMAGANTACTRVVAESLLARSGHDPEDQMRRYLQWSRTASAVSAELKRALALWQWSGKPHAGSHDPKNLDSHSLARTLAVALYTRTDAQRAIDLAAEVSRTTQQSPVVLDLCRLWAALFADALSGVSKQDLLAFTGPATTLLRQRTLKPALRSLLDGSADVEIATMNDAVSATRAAIGSFAAGQTLREALERAAVCGRAAPDALALCGALAGAHYGIQSAPAEWRRLTDEAGLCSMARRLLG